MAIKIAHSNEDIQEMVVLKTKGNRKFILEKRGSQEIYYIETNGVPDFVKLKINRSNKTGFIQFKSSSDSYSNGHANANSAYHDQDFPIKIDFDLWVSKYIEWFETSLSSG